MANNKTELKEFEVTIDQTWSETVRVKARNTREANKIGWEKWKPNKKNYKFYTHKKD